MPPAASVHPPLAPCARHTTAASPIPFLACARTRRAASLAAAVSASRGLHRQGVVSAVERVEDVVRLVALVDGQAHVPPDDDEHGIARGDDKVVRRAEGDGLGDGGEDRDGCGQPPRGRDRARVRGAGAQHNQPGDERPEEDGGAALERLLVDLAEALHLEAVPAEGGADDLAHRIPVRQRQQHQLRRERPQLLRILLRRKAEQRDAKRGDDAPHHGRRAHHRVLLPELPVADAVGGAE
mmetsp:Transcript_13317/g.41879  ORF Transcript_13317/g.41879 Transcript_13317/m.41879 type:complete len:239 (+) Transcript_13317:156-872(+)